MDRLPEDIRRREQVYDWLAIFFGTCGGIALIMLGVVSFEIQGGNGSGGVFEVERE
jgi:hypothetical protein